MADLYLRAYHHTCFYDELIPLNAGRAANDCEHRAVLKVDPELNAHLIMGHTYATPASAPLLLQARLSPNPNPHPNPNPDPNSTLTVTLTLTRRGGGTIPSSTRSWATSCSR